MNLQYSTARKLFVIIVAVVTLMAIVISSESIRRVQAQNDVLPSSSIDVQAAESDSASSNVSFVETDSQPGRPEVLITVKAADGYELENVELQIVRNTIDQPLVQKLVTDSNGQAVFDLAEEKAQALSEAVNSGTGRSDLNFHVSGTAVHQDAEGVWYIDIISAYFYKTYFDREVYLRRQLKEFRRDRSKQGLEAALPSEEAQYISQIDEDASAVEGQERVILEITAMPLEVGKVERVVWLPNGLETATKDSINIDPWDHCYQDRYGLDTWSIKEIEAKISEAYRPIAGTPNTDIKLNWRILSSFSFDIKGFGSVTNIIPAGGGQTGTMGVTAVSHSTGANGVTFNNIQRSKDILAKYVVKSTFYRVRCQKISHPSYPPTPIPTSIPDDDPRITKVWEVREVAYFNNSFTGSLRAVDNNRSGGLYNYDDLVDPNTISPCHMSYSVDAGSHTQASVSSGRGVTYSGSLSVLGLGFEVKHNNSNTITWEYTFGRPTSSYSDAYALYSLTGVPTQGGGTGLGCATPPLMWEKIGITYRGAPPICQPRGPEGECLEPTVVYPTFDPPPTAHPWPTTPGGGPPPTATPTSSPTPPGLPSCADQTTPMFDADNEWVWICNIEYIQQHLQYRVRFRNDGINPDGGSAMWCQGGEPCRLRKADGINLRAQSFTGQGFTTPAPDGGVASYTYTPPAPPPPDPTRPAVPDDTGRMECIEGCTGPVVSLDFNTYTSDTGSMVLMWDDPISFWWYDWNDPHWQVVYQVGANGPGALGSPSIIYSQKIYPGALPGAGGTNSNQSPCYVNINVPFNATGYRCLRFQPGGASNPNQPGPRKQQEPGDMIYQARACWNDSWNGSTYTACSPWSPGFIPPDAWRYTWVQVPYPQPIINSFSVSPNPAVLGDLVSMSWVTSGGTNEIDITRQRIDGAYYELFDNLSVPSGDFGDIPPMIGTYRYKIIAKNANGTSVTQEVLLTVTHPDPLIEQFSVTPSEVFPGSPVLIAWSVVNGPAAYIQLSRDGVILDPNLPPSGSLNDWPMEVGTHAYELKVGFLSSPVNSISAFRYINVLPPPTGCVLDGMFDGSYNPLGGQPRVMLTWDLSVNGACDPSPVGYNLWRGSDPRLDVAPEKLNKTLLSSPGSWQDLKVKPGQQYWYWIEIIYSDGTTSREEAYSNPIVIPQNGSKDTTGPSMITDNR